MIYIIHKKKFLFLILILFILICFILSKSALKVIATPISNKVIVIDPGHGGGDPGASGNNGGIEKEITLNIALKLQKIIEENGGNVLMTRVIDEMIGGNKRFDMKSRKELAKDENGDIFISIHLNSFKGAKCKGAQAFYANNDDSKLLAKCIQESIINYLDKNNKRVSKKMYDAYLLKNVKIPSVIIECGFLSDYEEEKMLMSDEYQNKMAYCIYLGIMEYLKNKR